MYKRLYNIKIKINDKEYIMKKLFLLTFSIFALIGCSNTQTQPTEKRTAAEKTAFILDVLVASAIYNETNFGAGKEYIKTKSTTNENSISNTTFSNGAMQTNTVTTSTTKTRSKGYGFGIGN